MVRVWYQQLTTTLVEKVGSKQSKLDDCIFYMGNVVYILYTDDSILFGPLKKEFNQVIQRIKEAGLNITIEGDVKDFLGATMSRNDNGTTMFSQPHLINKILQALQMGDQ